MAKLTPGIIRPSRRPRGDHKIIWELNQEETDFYIDLLEIAQDNLPYNDAGIDQDIKALREASERLWPEDVDGAGGT